MSNAKQYVEQDEHGTFRVGQLGVSLDSIVIAFQQGHTAESIQQQYPALTLEEVYGAVAYYLANRDQVHEYLDRQQQRWDDLRRRTEQSASPVAERLRGARRVASGGSK